MACKLSNETKVSQRESALVPQDSIMYVFNGTECPMTCAITASAAWLCIRHGRCWELGQGLDREDRCPGRCCALPVRCGDNDALNPSESQIYCKARQNRNQFHCVLSCSGKACLDTCRVRKKDYL